MADIRDPFAFINSRWRLSAVEQQTLPDGRRWVMPRGSGFGDLDAYLQLGRSRLFIEAKEYGCAAGHPLKDGEPPPPLPVGQRIALQDLVRDPDNTVWVLYGCSHETYPRYLVQWWNRDGARDELRLDWREYEQPKALAQLQGWTRAWVEAAEKKIRWDPRPVLSPRVPGPREEPT